MKTLLRYVAAMLALAALVVWLGTGANRGWTKTSVQKMIVDEVTGIESPVYEPRFVMGIDLLGFAWLVAATLAGISLFLHSPAKVNPSP